MAQAKRITFLVSNDIATDNRVLRIGNTLNKAGYECIITARLFKNSPALKNLPKGIKYQRFSLLFNKGPLFYLALNFRFFIHLLFNRNDIVCANDTDTLLAASLAVKIKHFKLVFDAHEYFTEVPELINHPKKQALWRKVEGFGIPKAHLCYTVSRTIADRFMMSYGKEFHLIRNISAPSSQSQIYSDKLPENFIIYQGVLNLGRGIELMIETMDFLPQLHLVICGEGDLSKALREKAKEKENIHFLGRIPGKALMSITQKAKLGLSLEENLGFNYAAALPNKIFSYLEAEIPCICSDLPEMSSIVSSHKIGEVLRERNPASLSNLISQIIANRENYQAALELAKKQINWEQESKKLIELYKTL